jgi:hypothetical protein
MKEFARASARLARLPLLARMTYTVFLAFTLAAVALSAWLGGEMVGADLSRFDEYYAGAPEAVSGEQAHPASGPQIDMPDEEPAPAEPMALRKLLEVTHFHLFSMPVYLMVLSHLFMLSSWSDRAKLTWIGLATVSVVAHLVAPWLARAGGAAARAFYAGSGILLGVTFMLLSAVPLIDMWLPRRRDIPRG